MATHVNEIRITLDASRSILETKWTVRGALNGAHFEVKITDAELQQAGWLGVFNVATACLLREAGLSAISKKDAEDAMANILAEAKLTA